MNAEPSKLDFAKALLAQPDNPFAAALTLVPNDAGRAIMLSMEWRDDPEVKAEMDRLIAERGPLAFLPQKEDIARDIYGLTKAEVKGTITEKLAAFRLYSELMGFIKQPDKNVNLQLNQNRVMIVQDMGTDEEWEASLKEQQKKLISESRH